MKLSEIKVLLVSMTKYEAPVSAPAFIFFYFSSVTKFLKRVFSSHLETKLTLKMTLHEILCLQSKTAQR